MSSVLLAGPPSAPSAHAPAPSPAVGQSPPGSFRESPAGAGERGNAATVLAGVGVLLLAMGVGVLIGRSGGSARPTAAAAPQVFSVATAPSTSTPASEATPFTDDWPAGTSGYTVELQKLSQAGTPTSAVEAAKTAASAKGAKEVGALKSEDFTSLTAGSYIVYSGVFHNKPAAEKALGALKKSFPGASVVKVSGAGAGAGAGAAGASPSGAAGGGTGQSGEGSSQKHPASPKVLEKLKKKSGKSYEQESKNLPNVVGT